MKLSPDRRSNMFWGIIKSDGTRRLINCPKSAEYVQILDSLVDSIFDDGVTCLQDDNAPIHRAIKVQKWVNTNGTEGIPWPTHSPDLKIIENVRSLNQKVISAQTVTFDNLERKFEDTRSKFSPDYIHKLYSSVPNRVQECI